MRHIFAIVSLILVGKKSLVKYKFLSIAYIFPTDLLKWSSYVNVWLKVNPKLIAVFTLNRSIING